MMGGDEDDFDCCPDCGMGFTCASCKKFQSSYENDEEIIDAYDDFEFKPRITKKMNVGYRTPGRCGCGEMMVQKVNKSTKNVFWGCPNFKSCSWKLTRDFDEHGLDAPETPLIQKKHLKVVIDKDIYRNYQCYYFKQPDPENSFLTTPECGHPQKIEAWCQSDNGSFPKTCPLKDIE